MNGKPKFKHAEALAVARELVQVLMPFVNRIEICGSLRRQKPMVSDIEILYEPRMDTRAKDLLETEVFSTADAEIGRLLMRQVILQRPNKNGGFTWGPLNKLAIHVASGIPVDFFSEPEPLDWWRSLVVRTGSAQFNRNLMEAALRGGQVRGHAYGVGLTSQRTGERISVDCESDFIRKCGMVYKPPQDR